MPFWPQSCMCRRLTESLLGFDRAELEVPLAKKSGVFIVLQTSTGCGLLRGPSTGRCNSYSVHGWGERPTNCGEGRALAGRSGHGRFDVHAVQQCGMRNVRRDDRLGCRSAIAARLLKYWWEGSQPHGSEGRSVTERVRITSVHSYLCVSKGGRYAVLVACRRIRRFICYAVLTRLLCANLMSIFAAHERAVLFLSRWA